ncbi:thiamine diphosphate-binding protein [Fusarium solani]|jgi:pyruvate decarboxylase|uniref:Pyruvate decarboxylase n=1 Tax=Fusarium solani TaxID=169388 RepID=A0A9P9G0C1_FUSSL|nr:thiamine diphosphate-binding protein [Fusarium solani]KAH7227235.1 thiamine diphosphate-binding protein [Fusarium solani]
MVNEIDLGEYLFKRLHEAGARAVHGVPGDYNLTALDYIEPAGLAWIGNCNELNAGYAADGYGRIKGIGALVTTFGVGELSAINAIAGAYAERSPLVHIVGTPARGLQRRGAKLHHSLCNGKQDDFSMFADMCSKITLLQENLMDPETAPEQIDRALIACVRHQRPVYIQLPADMVDIKVSSTPLLVPLNFSLEPNDSQAEHAAAEAILGKIYQAKQPFILVDAGASRFNMAAETNELVKATGFPTSTTPFGKGVVDETVHNFHGVYGTVGDHVYVDWVKECDLILYLGPFENNVNTYYFKTIPEQSKTVRFDEDSVQVGYAGGEPRTWKLHPKGLIRRILDRLDKGALNQYAEYPQLPDLRVQLKSLPPVQKTELLLQDTFWKRISEFFEPGDVVMTETGTPSTGGRDFVLPQQTTLINSGVWLSIGYMLGASQGVALAQRDLAADDRSRRGRTILFEGDGSFQMTAQELSTIIHKRLDIIIFLINNDGYTIERLVHGKDEAYNDIAPWRYLEAPSCFGAPTDGSYKTMTARAANWGELTEIISKDEFKYGSGLRMVEVLMDRMDAPVILKRLLESYSASAS